jgi:hypothetical protein
VAASFLTDPLFMKPLAKPALTTAVDGVIG